MEFVKKVFIIVCLCNTLAIAALHKDKTFFMPRMITTDPTIELTLSNYSIYHGVNNYSSCVSFFASPFHQKSKNGKDIARYFFPHHQSQIIVDQQGDGDIASAWLDLVSSTSNFHGQLCMRPERTINGGYFNLFFNFNNYCKGIWASVTSSVISAEHDLRMRETKSPNPGTIDDIHTIIDALNNPHWQHGKFSRCALKKTGIDDVQLKLGYNVFYLNQYHLGLYAVGTIPTGKKPKAVHIFEPIVGSTHGSIGFGINGDLPVYYTSTSEIVFMLDLKYRYLFAGKEWRSFDFCPNGDWSRYLLFTTKNNTAISTPGINYVTQELFIKPRTTFDLWLATHFSQCNCHVEIGYDLWLRVHEKIGELCPLPTDIAIFDLAGAARGNPVSASKATISEPATGPHQAPSNASFTPVAHDDFRLTSASHPRVLTHKIFGGLAYDGCIGSAKFVIGGATSYEFARTHAAFEQVAVWFTFGIQY